MKPCCDSSKNPDWRYIFSNNQYDDVLITVVEEVIRGQPDNEENFFQLNFASYFTGVDNTKPIAVNATEAEVLEATYEWGFNNQETNLGCGEIVYRQKNR